MKTLWILLLVFLLFSSCQENPSTPSSRPIRLPDHALYVPGQVAVGVKPGITYDFFASFADSLHLPILEWDYDHVMFWIEIPRGTADTYIPQIKADSSFTAVYQNTYSFSDVDTTKDYLSADYRFGKDASDTTYGKNIVQRLGLTVKRIVVFSLEGYRSALLSVPVGTENLWCEKLKLYPFVRYAQPNFIARVS